MSDPLRIALNVLNVAAGGTNVMGKHTAPEKVAQPLRSRTVGNRTTLNVRKCPHGHFANYARKNCKPCANGGK